MTCSTEILRFWFGEPGSPEEGKPRKLWFRKDPAFDQQLRQRFLPDYQRAAVGELAAWKTSPDSCLALILLLDQFPRNMFRGTPQMFATDAQALEIARHALSQGFDQTRRSVERWFIYLPFEHSEALADQEQCLELFRQLEGDPESAGAIASAVKHFEILQRFGRFPHRNVILGRPSTPEEAEFLQQPGSSF